MSKNEARSDGNTIGAVTSSNRYEYDDNEKGCFMDWCVTDYNRENWNFYKHPDITYEVWQLEKCPDTGRLHKQGYFELSTKRGLKWLKKHIDGQAHFGARRKSQETAAGYCMKNDTRVEGPFEKGTMRVSNQGKRNDLIEIKEMIDEGKSILEIANKHFGSFIRYHRGFEKYMDLLMKERTERPKVYWYWGKSGVGKTYQCIDKHRNSHYIKDGTQWWDGYNQEEAIIIDDFDGRWPYRDLLRLLDENKYRGQRKGGYVNINSPYIYITCEHPPNKFWSDNELEQIESRCFEIKELTGTNKRSSSTRASSS